MADDTLCVSDLQSGLLDRMVSRLVERGFVQTARVERAFRAVPRHIFLPGVPFDKVYSGNAILTRRGPDGLPYSSSSEVAIMAVMAEQLELEPGHRMLEIGAGTGYNAAILATLVGPEGGVTTMDLDEEISAEARTHLARAGVTNARVLTGDGWLGDQTGAPFDRIEATASVWDPSPHWHAQMHWGGMLVVPLFLRAGQQASIAFRKDGPGFRSASVRPAGFMRLRGPHGGPQLSAPIDGWVVGPNEITPEGAHILGRVLQTEPHVETAPVPPRGWFTRVALEDPFAFWTTHNEDHRYRVGIFIPERQSLAVFEWRYGGPEEPRLLAFGDDSALLRLREWLKPGAPLEVRHLNVDAIPAGSEIDTGGALVLRRPSFDVLIRYPSDPMV